jgi:NAD(P)H-flavin reductase
MNTTARVAPADRCRVGGSQDSLLVPRPYQVIAKRLETHDVTTLHVVPSDGGAPPEFRPAQVGMVGAFGIGEAALSISSAVDQRSQHSYTIRRAGPITNALVDTPIGATITVRGPFGRPWPIDDINGGTLVIVGGGLGLAPLRAVIHEALRRREDFTNLQILIGARTPRDLIFVEEYAAWAGRGAQVATIVDHRDEGWTGPVGMLPELLDDRTRSEIDWATATVLVCGPDRMMTSVSRRLLALGVDPTRVWLTMERNMQCGNALCGHCQFGPVIVCRDGPVVNFADIEPYVDIEEL